jgi:hypothetical protein
MYLDWPDDGIEDSHLVYRIDKFVDRWVDRLPYGSTILGAFGRSRIPWATWHIVDRACIGRCFSYANYEPASGQFRVRATARNAFVSSSAGDSMRMSLGTYVVRPDDLPLLQISSCGARELQLCLRPLSAGDIVGHSAVR